MQAVKNRRLFDARDVLTAGFVFAGSLVLYVRTLAPGLLLGDSAEFQVLGSTLGLAHTTGYPVYLILVKLVTLLPVGDIAYRANLASAIFAALTLAQVYLLGRALGGSRLGSLAGLLVLGFTPLFWWHAVIAEVYTAATAFISLVVLLLVVWGRTGQNRLLLWAGLAGGLGIGVHGMAPLVAPAAVIYVFARTIRSVSWKEAWLMGAAGALAGVLLWFGAFWALDRNRPPSNNPEVTIRYNLEDWDLTVEGFEGNFWVRFRYVISGRMFHEVMADTRETQVERRWNDYRATISDAFSPLVLGLAAAGLAGAVVDRTRWADALLLILSWAALAAFVVTYGIYDIWVFYIPTFVPLAASIGAGAGLLARLAGWLVRKIPGLSGHPASMAGAMVGCILAVAVLQPALPEIRTSWAAQKITFLTQDAFRYYPYPVDNPGWPADYARSVASVVEDNALIFSAWDLVYPLLYELHIEQGRTRIRVYETYRGLTDGNPSRMTVELMRNSIDTRPIYTTRIYDTMRAEFTFRRVRGLDLYRVSKR